MNFLGHLFFSNEDVQLQYANLYGDHVKGTDLSSYPVKIQQGINLHRTIDNYIDHHEAVLDLLHQLYGDLPKVAGIAVDLYFDHLLAKHWEKFHSLQLTEFIERFYNTEIENKSAYSDSFLHLIQIMKKQDWLNSYRKFNGLEHACNGLSRRISFPNVLGNAPRVFLEKEQLIYNAFRKYMDDAIPYFRNYFAV